MGKKWLFFNPIGTIILTLSFFGNRLCKELILSEIFSFCCSKGTQFWSMCRQQRSLSYLSGMIFASAHFSSTETSMMTINRYRLRHALNKVIAQPKE